MYITLLGQEVYYQKSGKGKGLVLLHGWQQDVSSFWGIVDLLKDQFTIYLIDLPGFGRSLKPKKPFTVLDYANVINEFIKKLELEKPILLGHSVGGRIAIKLAASNPASIGKLILEDSAGIKPKRDIVKFLIYPLAKLFHYTIPNIFNLKEKIRYKFYKALESDYIYAEDLKETLTNILAEDITEDIKNIKTETLLIWGEKDKLPETSLKNAKKMYQLIENSRLEVIDEVGHSPHLEKPELFTYYVKDFC